MPRVDDINKRHIFSSMLYRDVCIDSYLNIVMPIHTINTINPVVVEDNSFLP